MNNAKNLRNEIPLIPLRKNLLNEQQIRHVKEPIGNSGFILRVAIKNKDNEKYEKNSSESSSALKAG